MRPYIKNRLWILFSVIVLIFICKVDFYTQIRNILSTLYPVIIALLFAWFLIPLKVRAEGYLKNIKNKHIKKYSNQISAFLIYILFLLAIFIFIVYLIPILKDGITESYGKLSEYYMTIEKYIPKEKIDNIIEKIDTRLYIVGAKNTLLVIFSFVMSLIILIYILLEHKKLKKNIFYFLELVAGIDKTERLIYYISKTNIIFTNYFCSKFVSSMLLGIIIIAGFFVIGISYPIFFGITVALTNMIPVFGIFISGVPIFLTALSEYGLYKAVAAIIVITAGQQIENNILTPKIVGNKMGLSGFWILFSVILGGGLFGFWGILVCIPVASTIKEFILEYAKRK